MKNLREVLEEENWKWDCPNDEADGDAAIFENISVFYLGICLSLLSVKSRLSRALLRVAHCLSGWTGVTRCISWGGRLGSCSCCRIHYSLLCTGSCWVSDRLSQSLTCIGTISSVGCSILSSRQVSIRAHRATDVGICPTDIHAVVHRLVEVERLIFTSRTRVIDANIIASAWLHR